MKNTNETKLAELMEPIYRFSLKRMQNIQDAEDLSQEILLHAIRGMSLYSINDFESWIWKVAHNRYNIFLRQKYAPTELVENFSQYDSEAPDTLDEVIDMEIKDQLFLSLHCLSAMYRDILVQYYFHERPLKQIAALYSLPESTIKWRLHYGKEKIKERMELNMSNKIYERINWWIACNGNMDSNKYLDSQIRRAICLTAYESPMSIEEISKVTGVPAMYIEDEINYLEYGDAIVRQNAKYATDFIILKKRDSERMLNAFHPLIDTLADKIIEIYQSKRDEIDALKISGINNNMDRLGYILVPLLIRQGVELARERNGQRTPPFPIRKDGGNGWFIVEEGDGIPLNSSGCNYYIFNNDTSEYISWFWIGKYFDQELNVCLNELINGKIRIITKSGGFIPPDIDEETTARLLKLNLIEKCNGLYKPVFSTFTGDELTRFTAIFEKEAHGLSFIVEKLVLSVYEGFKVCIPERLHLQILGVFGGFLNSIIGLAINELQNRGVLAPLKKENLLTANIMYVNMKCP